MQLYTQKFEHLLLSIMHICDTFLYICSVFYTFSNTCTTVHYIYTHTHV